MRRKKHKATRRGVEFYKIHHGFREPFKVLLDGNFIHAAVQANMQNLDKHICNLLGGQCKLYTTKCVSHELRTMSEVLGEDANATRAAARGFMLHKCNHSDAVSPSDCLRAQVGKRNPDHWMVATLDKELQAHLSKIPAAPVIFANVNGIHLQTPSVVAKSAAKEIADVNLMLPEHELRTDALKDLHTLRPRDTGGAKFRKKKAKGPNPLAVRKKKTLKVQHHAAPAATPPTPLSADKAKKRIRKRPKNQHNDATVE